jgi:hypothetical protein
MAATYPTGIATFVDKVNVTDIIDASHPNAIQSEVIAIETTLGASPNLSTTPNPAGTFTSTATTFGSVNARLANIETGIVADTHTQYLRKAGDSANVITANSSAIKGLVIKGAASQSANLQEWQNSSGTVLAFISPTGVFNGSTTASADLTVSTKSTAYTLLLTDKNGLIVVDSASPLTITVSQNSTTAFPQGAQVTILRKGTGAVTIAGAGTASIVGTPGLKLRAQYSSATLIKLDSADSWVLVGDLSA